MQDTRVHLNSANNTTGNEYINASYVNVSLLMTKLGGVLLHTVSCTSLFALCHVTLKLHVHICFSLLVVHCEWTKVWLYCSSRSS